MIRRGLEKGPVLVQVPRSGTCPAIACDLLRTRAQCPHCAAPLSLAGRNGPLHCRVCGRREDGLPLSRMRSHPGAGDGDRLPPAPAEELHRAFPDTAAQVAGGAHGALEDDAVPDRAIIVATRARSPPRPDGYVPRACCWTAERCWSARAFDADVEAVRRWRLARGSLVRSADDGGEVLVVGTSTLPAIRDLVAHRSSFFIDRVLEDRHELDLPPFSRVAEITGDREACRTFLETVELPDGTDVFGPVDLEGPDAAGRARAVVRLEPSRSRELAAALRATVERCVAPARRAARYGCAWTRRTCSEQATFALTVDSGASCVSSSPAPPRPPSRPCARCSSPPMRWSAC